MRSVMAVIIATDIRPGSGSIQFLEARHRGHAWVEDRIRCGKDTGIGRFSACSISKCDYAGGGGDPATVYINFRVIPNDQFSVSVG